MNHVTSNMLLIFYVYFLCIFADVNSTRNLLHELQAAYFDLLEVKLKIFERTSSSLQPKLLQKMAFLCKEGANVNDQILRTYESGADDNLEINTLLHQNEPKVKPILIAWFSKARFLF